MDFLRIAPSLSGSAVDLYASALANVDRPLSGTAENAIWNQFLEVSRLTRPEMMEHLLVLVPRLGTHSQAALEAVDAILRVSRWAR